MNKIRLGDVRNTNDLKILVNGCEIVKGRGNEDWQVADIISAVYSGNVFFSVCDGTPDVIVYYIKTDPYTNENYLWVWVAYVTAGRMDSYIDEFRTTFKQMGINKMHWTSKRIGWARRLKKLGSNMVQIEYKMDL